MIYDAVVIPGGSAEIVAKQALVVQFVREAFSHYKPIAAIGDGAVLLDAAKVDKFAPGMITVSEEDFIDAFKIAMLKHLGDREKPGATPPSHRMFRPFLGTNATAWSASPRSKRGSVLAVKGSAAVGPPHLLFLNKSLAQNLIDG